MASYREDDDPFEEDIVFDQAGLLTNTTKMNSAIRRVSSGKCGLFAKTLGLCGAFFGLGLCIAIPGPTFMSPVTELRADASPISSIYVARSSGYLIGSMIGGILFDRFNRLFLLFVSLLLTAVFITVTPWCHVVWLLTACMVFLGMAMGFLDTGGNVLCLDLWGRNSGPFMQALHFSFGLGAFVAPLLAAPFLEAPTTDVSMPLLTSTHAPFQVSHLSEMGVNRDKRDTSQNEKYITELIHNIESLNSSSLEFTTESLDNVSKPTSSDNLISVTPIWSVVSNTTDGPDSFNTTVQPISTTHRVPKRKPSKTNASSLGNKNWDHIHVGSVPEEDLQPDSSPTTTSASTSTSTASSATSPLTSYSSTVEQSLMLQAYNTTSLTNGTNTNDTQNPTNKTTDVAGSSGSRNEGKDAEYSHIKIDYSVSSTVSPTEGITENLLIGTRNNSYVKINESTHTVAVAVSRSTEETVPKTGLSVSVSSYTPVTTHSYEELLKTDSYTTSKIAGFMPLVATKDIMPVVRSGDVHSSLSLTDATRNMVSEQHRMTSSTEESPVTRMKEMDAIAIVSDTQNTLSKHIHHSKPVTYDDDTEEINFLSLTNATRNMVSEKHRMTSSTEESPVTRMKEVNVISTVSDTQNTLSKHIHHSKPVIYDDDTEEINSLSLTDATRNMVSEKDRMTSITEESPVTRMKEVDVISTVSDTQNTLSKHSHHSKPVTYDNDTEEINSLLNIVASKIENYGFSKVQFTYIMVGLFEFVMSLIFLGFLCHNPRDAKSKQEEGQGTKKISNRALQDLLIGLMAIFYFLYVGLVVTYGQLVVAFAVHSDLHLAQSTGLVIAFVFWGSFAAMRFASIFFSSGFGPTTMLVLNFVFCTVATVLLSAVASRMETALWVGTALLGIGLASVFPTGILWIERYIHVSNKVAAAFVMGAALGQMLCPVAVYQLMVISPAMLMHSAVVINLLCIVTFVVLRWLALRNGEKYCAVINNGYQLANQEEEDEMIDNSPSGSVAASQRCGFSEHRALLNGNTHRGT